MDPSEDYLYIPPKPIICNLEEDSESDGCKLQKKINDTNSNNKKLAES
jgi:hypothetical protein